jgi:HAMP domain-containing protein
MDFIEQWAHVSPDGGSGALEALYVFVAAAVAATAVFRLAVARRIARKRSSTSEAPR